MPIDIYTAPIFLVQEYPGSFQNKLVNFSFKSVPQYIASQTKPKRKGGAFWNVKHRLISKLTLTGGSNVNYYKSVYHPIPTGGNREHPANFQNKSQSSPFNLVSRYILFLAKPKGRRRSFVERARRWAHCEITPKST